MSAIDELLGTEVFVFGPKTEAEPEEEASLGLDIIFGEVEVFPSKLEALDGLNEVSVGQFEEGMTLVAGSIVGAMSLPAELPEDVTTYILAFENYKGALIEVPAGGGVDFLCSTIRDMVKDNPYIDIEDVYIVFGYELELSLSFNADELDEEKSSTCKELAQKLLDVCVCEV